MQRPYQFAQLPEAGMKSYHNRMSKPLVSLLAIFALALFLIAPARAQEATEPSVSSDSTTVTPTDAPTDVPTAIPSDTPTEAPTDIPTPAPTEEPSATPDVTTAPENTATAAPTGEATSTATSQPTEQPTTAATPESQVFADDFQAGANPGWALDGWTVATEGENAFLTTGENEKAASIGGVALADFTLSVKVRIDAAAQANLALDSGAGAYTLVVDSAGEVDLYRDGARLTPERATTPEPDATSVWRRLDIAVRAGAIGVAVDNEAKVSYTDPNPLAALTFAFSKSGDGNVSIDDVVINRLEAPATLPPETAVPTEQPTEAVTAEPTGEATLEATAEVTPESTLEATAEATGEATPESTAEADLSETAKNKLDTPIYELLQSRSQAADVQAGAAPTQRNIIFDDAGRLSVVIWAAIGQKGSTLATDVQAVGGVVDVREEHKVEARVPLDGLRALANLPEVGTILLPSIAASTGPVGAPHFAPSGTAEGFDLVGANPWHTAGFTGGVNIAVIDTGFVTTGATPADYACLKLGGLGTGSGTHGIAVAEVICDIAPGASVKGYAASTPSAVASQINLARGAGFKIILIALDMGVHTSPGDGVGTNSDAAGVYSAIKTARDSGVLVIAAAGNNNGRYKSFAYTGTAVTVNITANIGDFVNISWSAWDTNNDLNFGGTPVKLSDGGVLNLSKPNRTTGDPGHQFIVNNCNHNPSDPGYDPTNPTRCIDNLTLTIPAGAPAAQVQVQVIANSPLSTAAIGTVTGATVNANAGNLARPADSPYALTVGAVCAQPDLRDITNFDGSLAISSKGPIFTAGGGGADNAAPIKPDLVAPAGVSISTSPLNGATGCDGKVGFGGTSAAAAHVAGMAALVLSKANTNTDPSFKTYMIGTGVNTGDRLKTYLLSHTADMPFSNPDGLDKKYGRGVTVLGNPDTTDFMAGAGTSSFTALAVPCGVSRIYVNPLNFNKPENGTSPDTGYQSVSNAVDLAAPGQCVTLVPGEYTTPVTVVNDNVKIQSYQAAVSTYKASAFWVALPGPAGAGIDINGRNTVLVDGFKFTNMLPYANLGRPNGIRVRNSTGTTVSNNIFTNFKAVGNQEASSPILITGSSSQNVTITGNTFTNNDSLQGAAIAIEAAGGTTPILIERNSFTNNSVNQFPTTQYGVINITNSQVNIKSNRFTGNSTKSIILVKNSGGADTYNVNVFSNAFFSNQNKGPIVNLAPGRRFRFLNNTVANNNAMEGTFSAIILRGDKDDSSSTTFGGLWEIHNNLFFDNFVDNSLISFIKEIPAGKSSCDSISGGPASDNGARNNYYFNTGTTSGVCQGALADPSNKSIDMKSWFVYQLLDPNETDPYQLLGNAGGVDQGNNALVSAFIPPAVTGAVDALGNPRVSGTGGTPSIDLGAYEFQTVNVKDYDLTFAEDSTITNAGFNQGYLIDLLNVAPPTGPIVTGGYKPYTIQIQTYPTNYDPNPNNACGGQPLLYNPTTQKILYCPPPNYYNSGEPGGDVIPPVTFTYKALDRTGIPSQSTGTATINITPTTDPILSNPNPANPIGYTVVVPVVNVNTPFSFRLRPYVRFNNFRLTATTNGQDYPYTYIPGSIIDPTEPDCGGTSRTDIIAAADAETALDSAVSSASPYGGQVNITLAPNQSGCLKYQYSVQDAQNGTPVQFTVLIRVVDTLPTKNLHDDTSFNFTYRGTNAGNVSQAWTAAYSEPNINNTLHQTNALNDTAEFLMLGTSFSLYMQATGAGGFWELQIATGNDDTAPLSFNWNGKQSATAINDPNVVCRTTAKTGTLTNSKFISNSGTALYVVTCSGMTDDEPHYIRVINRQAGRQVAVDAISILNDITDPLKPGFHEVTESQLAPLFPGWTLVTNTQASNQRALSIASSTPAPVSFDFQGTGVAIGTALQKSPKLPVGATVFGAKYDFCVAPQATPANKVCQTYDNGFGATTTTVPTWGVYRPFIGLDPSQVYTATIQNIQIPTGATFYIDSIVVLDRQVSAPTPAQAVLPFGTTDDSQRNLFVFGNGLDSTDTWSYDANNTLAYNRTLTSIKAGVKFAGPFVSFDIPDTANAINWYRRSSTTDSQAVLVCVDRAQLTPSDQNTFCKQYDLRTAGNPLVIKASDFGAKAWGSAMPGQARHTVEIFSISNQTFNFDYVQVLNTNAPLYSGYYEQNTDNIRYFGSNLVPSAPPTITPFTTVKVAAASGGSVASTAIVNSGAVFQFHGTGFTTYFTLDPKADAVKICWITGAPTPIDTTVVTNTLAGTCQTFDNRSATTRYKAGRSVLGLPENDYTVVVQMLDNPAHPATAKPITMQLDAVQIYGTPLPGNVLNITGQRYETSFANTAADNRFAYYGNTWKSVSGTAANLYSGKNYDSLTNEIGGGVVFQMNNANWLTIYRDTRAGLAPVQVCVTDSTGALQLPCTLVTNTTPTGNQQKASIPLTGTAPYVVSITTTDYGIFNLDAIEIGNGGLPEGIYLRPAVTAGATLTPGFYEDDSTGLTYTESWTTITATTYTAGHAKESTTGDPAPQNGSGDTMTFSFTGAPGFEVGTTIDLNGGEMEVCVNTSNTFPANRCYIYENENTLSSKLVSRSITGLEPTQTYFVRVRNAEDGNTVIPPVGPRKPTNPVKLHVDFVNIFPATPVNSPALVNATGLYNEDAVDGSGVPYLQLQPANRWAKITGTAANAYSGKSYVTVADSFGRASNLYAGPAATLRVAVPAQGATVVLFTGVGTTTNPAEVLACAVMQGTTLLDPTVNCKKLTNLRTSNQIVLTNTDIPALGSAGNVTLSIRALTPGSLKIDGFLVVLGKVLQPGLYDDALMSAGGVLDTTGSTWTYLKSPSAYNGGVMTAAANNSALKFQFTGTGFEALAQVDSLGTDMRLCYVTQANYNGTDVSTSTGAVCTTYTTDTANTVVASNWNSMNGKNGNRPNPATGYTYGFSVYGLANTTYQAEVRLLDTTVAATDRLKIDGIAIFGDVKAGGAGSRLLPGTLYDDTNATGIRYEPAPLWTSTTALYGPPRGPYLKTETSTLKAGSVMQVYLNGNALVLYQQAASANSRSVRVCVIDSQSKLQCSTFSQNYARLTYFSPIVFYGLGSNADHVVILENLDYNKKFNVDGLQVLP
jgi:outer membrane biosynthesis protein TonB